MDSKTYFRQVYRPGDRSAPSYRGWAVAACVIVIAALALTYTLDERDRLALDATLPAQQHASNAATGCDRTAPAGDAAAAGQGAGRSAGYMPAGPWP